MQITIEELNDIIYKHNPSYISCLNRFEIILIEYIPQNYRYNTWSARCLCTRPDHCQSDILLHIRPIGNLLHFDYESL